MNNPWKVATISLVVVIIALAAVYAVQVAGVGRAGGVTYSGTLSAPSGSNPFGGSAVGSYSAQVSGHLVTITASLSQPPPSGKVFEGWLVDPNTSYKLSIGLLDGTKLQFSQSMVNPAIYKVLVITIEDPVKTNPNPSGVIEGGSLLPQGFGM
jgi:hypothetical protein